MPGQPFAKLYVTALAVFAAVMLIAPPARADEAKKSFNIPAQELGAALREFAHQSNREILFSTDVVHGKMTKGVKGELSADAALAKLLAGTGLVVAKSADGTTLVTTPDAKEAPAQSGPSIAPSGTTNNPYQNRSSNDARAVRSAELEEVVVTGSRIPLSPGQQSVHPVRRYTREDIANSGQSTMGEFLNTLPDVSNFTYATFQLGYAGMQTVQLHGLPIGTTLTLLDGRPVETSSLGLFDLGNIPVSAVEKVEVLPVGASAIYGADALGGAVNFILRKDLSGFEANASLDSAPGVHDPGFNLAWGKRWDRGSISLIASYEAHDELLGTQREPISSTTYPASFPVVTLGFDGCAPGNVYTVDGSNLPGLTSNEAAIPRGITGKPTVQQFAATAGTLNVCNPQLYRAITPQSQREGALLSAHVEVAEFADLFTETLLSHRHLQNQIGPQIGVSQFFGGTVAASNPYNPFGEDVNVSFVYPGSGQQELQSTYLVRPMIGVRGSLPAGWHYEATATLSRDRIRDSVLFTDSTGIVNALASSAPATALNPFASGAPGSPQLLSSLSNPAVDNSITIYDDQLLSGQFIVRGPLALLPAGAIQAVVGGEWNQERERSANNASIVSVASDIALSRHSYAAFGETRVPLWAGRTNSPSSERLALTLAGRYDHSSDFGGKATGQGALSWRATDTVSLDGSYGVSYRAPRLNEIAGPQFVTPNSLLGGVDPFRGGEAVLYPMTIVSGPNYNLQAETGSSSTFGVHYSSETAQGLRASATWYDLKIQNFIGIPSTQAVLDNPNLFPGVVVRAPPTPQDLQQGFLGVITQYNFYNVNFGDLRVTGVDADVSYLIDSQFGQFTPALAIANIYRWQSALTPGSPPINGVGQATFAPFTGVGWAPRWKGTASLSWKRSSLSLNVAGRYVGSYRDYQELVPNNHETGDTWIFDTSARYELDQAFAQAHPHLGHAYISLAIVNVFNKLPPFAYTGSGYDYSEYDVRGRYLRLNVGVRY